MKLSIDLHSHSGYSGGVGKIDLDVVAQAMKWKGIDVFGTGDCLHPYWSSHLQSTLVEKSEGLFSLPGNDKSFILQTEIVVTAPPDGVTKGRKTVHMVILFPDFKSIDKAKALFRKKGVKNTIGRPFVTNDSVHEVSDFLFDLQGINEDLLIFPAHVMTPEGIFGSKVPITYMEEFFGDYSKEIRLIETGLSADPDMLDRIPECHNLNYISNSDCHSAALHRIGREFTVIETKEKSFRGIRDALVGEGIVSTFEFNPREGKFFGSGHRKGKMGHEDQHYLRDAADAHLGRICPVCNKPMTIGVMERVIELEKKQRKSGITVKNRQFKSIIPLIEVIAYGLNIKTFTSKRIIDIYHKIIKEATNEVNLWFMDSRDTRAMLSGKIDEHVMNAVMSVQQGNFSFDPPGYDGEYGKLKL